MSALVKWLLRKRDQCSVTYSRFGLPGDVVDDRPQPTRIYVEPFDDNHSDFLFYKTCHSTKAALACAGFGMSVVIFCFLFLFFKFDWYSHTSGVDTLTLLILFFFLFFGVRIHYDVIVGIKRQSAHYLLPFIIVYAMSIGGELALFFYLLSHMHFLSEYTVATPSKKPFIFLMIVTSTIIFIQTNMLLAVLKCRFYLTKKAVHAVALKVAEKTMSKYPGIQIVVAGSDQSHNMEINIPEMEAVMPETAEASRVTSTNSASGSNENTGLDKTGSAFSETKLLSTGTSMKSCSNSNKDSGVKGLTDI
uniref:Uncharacterized protein n=1 Tax=Syphacia muris TaxID=451379 RepID=A0A0N5AUQ7_9BILA